MTATGIWKNGCQQRQQDESVVGTGLHGRIEGARVEVLQKPDRTGQHDEIAKCYSGDEQEGRHCHQWQRDAALAGAKGGGDEGIELPKDDRQREQQREVAGDGERLDVRLAQAEGHRLAALGLGRGDGYDRGVAPGG